ncbi:MAG: NAAT family transporter [Deltaproteobacteria bacterium]|nr:NAAT family transporter [Deltaproteobacteria bacterium]
MLYLHYFLHATVALLAMVNPLEAVQFFPTFTQGGSPAQLRQAALKATFYAFMILTVSALVGRYILMAFGISTSAFQAAGGLVIMTVGFRMLWGMGQDCSGSNAPNANPAESVGLLVPFVMPIVTGPGAITTAITLVTRQETMQNLIIVQAAIVVNAVILWLSLRASVMLSKRIGHRIQDLISRFMGLILLAIGSQLLMTGVRTFFVDRI